MNFYELSRRLFSTLFSALTFVVKYANVRRTYVVRAMFFTAMRSCPLADGRCDIHRDDEREREREDI